MKTQQYVIEENTGLLSIVEDVMHAGTSGGCCAFDECIDFTIYEGLDVRMKEQLVPSLEDLSNMSDEMCAAFGTLLAKNCKETYNWDMNVYDANADEVRVLVESLEYACEELV